MEVLSIADFEQEQMAELDHNMASAIDQLVSLTQPEVYWPTLQDLLYRFGNMSLDEDASNPHFDFSLPSTCQQWPGPRFGAFSLHKAITKPSSKSKAKRPGADGHNKIVKLPKPHPRPLKMKPTSVTAPKVCTSVASRDPPLRLLDLPPEIRNLVWSLLAVHEEQLEAQLRQIRPCKKLTTHRKSFVRRFPQEPVVAMVNKQVRREVLSIFYGTNHFCFERNACARFAKYSMLNPPNMLKWKPTGDLAGFLTSIDLRFNALPRTLGMVQIVYDLKRKPDGCITVDVTVEKTTGKKIKKFDGEQFCLCDELSVAAAIVASNEMDRERDLADCAMNVVRTRHDRLFAGPAMQTTKLGNFFPPSQTCMICEKATFEIVYSGL